MGWALVIMGGYCGDEAVEVGGKGASEVWECVRDVWGEVL